MAFGVLFDFTGNSNVSKVIKAADMVQQQWFLDAVKFPKPIDLFLVIGHNPVRSNVSTSTFGTVFNAIRKQHPDTPIQMFGGHTHIRDFAVYDNKATAMEAGRYCETLGWVSMSGLSRFYGRNNPRGVPNPSQKAIPPVIKNSTIIQSKKPSDLRYFRRYLDWNRKTFAYHAQGSQDPVFDTQQGKAISAEITAVRTQLNLTSLYGCAPATYCTSCKPFMAEGNLFKLLSEALSTVVVNQTRSAKARIIIINTGSVRFDLAQGPFTYDDSFIVSPFSDSFRFIPDVPYKYASVRPPFTYLLYSATNPTLTYLPTNKNSTTRPCSPPSTPALTNARSATSHPKTSPSNPSTSSPEPKARSASSHPSYNTPCTPVTSNPSPHHASSVANPPP